MEHRGYIFRFGDIEVDERNFSVTKAGQVLPFEPKVFKVLQFLLHHPDRVVTKEELLGAVWNDCTVSESSLTRNVATLRRLLGDDIREPLYIATVPTIGYRFLCNVQVSGNGFVLGSASGTIAESPAEPSGATSAPLPAEPCSEVHPPHPPKGRHAFYWAIGGVAAAVAVVAAWWLAARPETPVVESVTQLTDDGEAKDWFAPIETDGARVYFTEKYAGNFRLAQVAASGGPVAPVPTQIPGAYRATISPDYSGLLVTEYPIGRHLLWFQPLPAGDPVRLGNLEAQGTAFTPDGRQIVYTDGDTINIADRDSANARKIADLPGMGYCPAVSPNGKKIRVTVVEGNSAWLWEMGSDGKGVRRLAFESKNFSNTSCGRFMPDGRNFVFQTGNVGDSEIWAISEKRGFLDKPNPVPTRLTNGPLSCNLPTPSMDGKQVFVRCDKLRGELVRYDRKLKQFIPFLGGISAIDVGFSRDGAWVVYLSYPDQSLWRMRADGRDRVRLTYPTASASSPRISPDGTKIVFAQGDWGSKWDLYVVGMEERTPQKIVEGTTDSLDPYWSPNGQSLVFDVALPGVPAEQGSSEVHILDLKSGRVSAIPQSRGKSHPAWVAPETLVVTADDGSKVLRYEFKTQSWTDLAAGPYSGCTSTDDKYVYCTTTEPVRPAAVRIRVADGRVEPLADLSELKRIATYGTRELNLTPNGELLFTRDIGTQEIYALNIRWP